MGLTDVQKEFKKATNLGSYYGVATGVPTTGQLKMSDLYCKSGTTTGHVEYLTAGTYTWTVQPYTSMTWEVSGASGGSGTSCWDGGSFVGTGGGGDNGTNSSITTLITAGAGAGGGGSTGGRYPSDARPGAKGLPGQGSSNLANATVTAGGGQKGGIGIVFLGTQGANGKGGDGGDGGLVKVTFDPATKNAPKAGDSLTLIVGKKGLAATGPGSVGANGLDGYIKINWT